MMLQTGEKEKVVLLMLMVPYYPFYSHNLEALTQTSKPDYALSQFFLESRFYT
jgi:hypothetical protein